MSTNLSNPKKVLLKTLEKRGWCFAVEGASPPAWANAEESIWQGRIFNGYKSFNALLRHHFMIH